MHRDACAGCAASPLMAPAIIIAHLVKALHRAKV
jgi:hypothetical protein